MSFISMNLKTDYEKIYNLFVTLFKHEPLWADVAETDLAVIAPIINEIVSKFSGTGAQVDVTVAAVLSSIQKDIVLATKFIQSLDSSKNLSDVLNAILSNLQGLLTLSSVKSSALYNEVTVLVSSIALEIQTILANLPK